MNKYAASILLSFCAATAGAASNWTVVADLDLREAIHSYDKAIALEPGHALAHFQKGEALKELQQWAPALASYEQAILLDKTHAASHLGRAQSLLALKQWDAAQSSYKQASALQADDAHIHHAHGKALAPVADLQVGQEKVFQQAVLCGVVVGAHGFIEVHGGLGDEVEHRR